MTRIGERYAAQTLTYALDEADTGECHRCHGTQEHEPDCPGPLWSTLDDLPNTWSAQ